MKPPFYKILTGIIIILFSSASIAQIYKPKMPLTPKPIEIKIEDFIPCHIHPNFMDIVQHLYVKNGHIGNTYVTVQVTTVDPAQKVVGAAFERPSHYFTSWSQSEIAVIRNPCANLNFIGDVRFSDRNVFTGETDRVEFSFNTKENSVTITLKSWGDVKRTYRNLIRKGSVLYHVDANGRITAFNFFLGKGIIQ